MAKIQCKMCGGELNLPENTASGTCEYCGTLITFPKVSDERLENLYNRAEHFRKIHDYGKAVQVYEQFITANPEDSEAYWGLVLSRYGIEYVEDPASHERIPTCHRMSYDSILSDADYLSALEHAGYAERQIYENEAKRIAEIQKGILAISSQEQPFDVFICYKESDDYGRRTKDSVIAQEIYYELTDAGYKVFFSRVTLESKLGQQYEPYIFAALNSAKVMLVVGSKKEYFEAVWVRNEWSRYLELMKKDRKRLLIPCYKDMDAYDIPDELSMFQSQDMGKIGFVQDVLRGIQKVCKKEESKPAAAAPVVNPGNSNANALLRRAEIMISTGDFENARSYLQRFLDQDPENGWGYFNLILTELQLTDRKMLVNFPNIRLNSNFKLAEQFADDKLKELLNEIIHEQEEIKRKAEEEQRRLAEEQRRLAEEQRKAEEERRRLEAERRARNQAVSEASYGRKVLLRQYYDLEYALNGPSSLAQRLQGCIDRENHLQSNPELSEAEISDIIMTSEATMAECGDLEVKKQLLEQKRKKQTKITLSVLAAIALIVFCCFIPTIIDHIRGYETSDGVLVKVLDRTRSEFEIHDGVTTIGAYAFSECSNLKSITIPDSVTSIGNSAFYDCDYLTSVTIPDSVTSIGNSAFYDCDYLTTITIPNSVTEIGSEVFYGCDNLTTITIPDSVTSIGDSAFSRCSNLKSITIPDSVTSIGDLAFHGCSNLTSITIPDSVSTVGDKMLSGCSSLTSVTIPSSVKSIGWEAFFGCDKLTNIIIPERVTSIRDGAFANCSELKFAYIPKDCLISETAFDSSVQLIQLSSEDYKTLEQAEKGNAEAQYRMGKICSDHKMYDIAVEWYRKAADQGLAEAQFNLGFCYEKGEGVAKNLVEALKWYRKAADQGKAEAKTRAERIEAEAVRIEAERKKFEAQFKALGPEELTLPGGIKLEMVMIPAGSFQREGNIVTLTKPFYLGKYEVTQAQWQAVMGSNPSRFKGDNLPVERVSWHDAKEFCKKLNEIYADKLPAGYQFDLPTEAQWEYACRAGTTTNYSYGDASDASKMNFDGNYPYGGGAKDIYRGRTVEVGSLGYKNAFGLYDMHGNVWEWCRDWYGDYPGGSVTDPVGPSSGSDRVIRGGSWYYYADFCRSARRDSLDPSYRNYYDGFRLALASVQ